MRTVILVPWRTDGGPRENAWQVCRSRWEALFPDWVIYEGPSPEGPFQRSAAINAAARKADDDGRWDLALVIDADVLLSRTAVREAVNRAAETGRVTWAHRRWRQIDEESTNHLVGPKGLAFAEGALGRGGVTAPEFTADLDLIVSSTKRLSWSCCIAIRRDAWDAIGGFDERFIGWGHEDGAFMAAAGALVGWDRVESDVLNLWHPRLPGAGVADKTGRRQYTSQALVNGRLGMRYAIALRRDHGLTDRSEPSPPEVLERDIANLVKYDNDFGLQQPDGERKRWTDWWPTIPELVEGARLFNTERRYGTVTAVITSGGTLETWPSRSEWLKQALASLNANVSGPIIQRVVYTDWPDELLPEVKAIAEPYGFYIAGEGHHGYTGMRQRLWLYLSKHARGSYVFASEDDFLLDRPVDLGRLIEALSLDPHLAQVALLRDPFYQDEKDTGGILGWPEPAFTKKQDRLEHRLFFTANPSLFRKALTDVPWPDEKKSRQILGRRLDQSPSSETAFGRMLLRDNRVRFAFWGDGSIWCRHVGAVRAGSGY